MTHEAEADGPATGATIQIDALDDSVALLQGTASAPPPLPPRGARAEAERPRWWVYLAGVLVAAAAAAAGLWAASMLAGDPEPAEVRPSLEIGPVQVTTD